jgi:hypothetical protein
MVMERFINIFNELVVNTSRRAIDLIVLVAPKILFSAIILLMGWVFAALLKKVITKLLNKLGFDTIAKKSGLKNLLEKGNIKKDSSAIIGVVSYWMIMFTALVMVFNTLNLEVASTLLQTVVFYIPQIIVALVLISLGVYLAKFISDLVKSSAAMADISFKNTLGSIAYALVVGVAIMMALEQLGVARSIITQFFVFAFGVLPLVVTLVLLVGGRETVANIIAGRFLLNEFEIGDQIKIDALVGKLESIDITSTKLICDSEEVIIPNSELSKKVVRRGGEKVKEKISHISVAA